MNRFLCFKFTVHKDAKSYPIISIKNTLTDMQEKSFRVYIYHSIWYSAVD